MTSKLTDRLQRLEARAVPAEDGAFLVFPVEAPPGTPQAGILEFLRERGHDIRDEDSVLIGRLGSGPLRDLRQDLVAEIARGSAAPATAWPRSAPSSFTFRLDRPESL